MEVGGEADFVAAVSRKQLGQIALVDEGVARFEGSNLAFVVVDTHDVVADLREADGRHQAHITGANDCNLNRFAHSLQAGNVLDR